MKKLLPVIGILCAAVALFFYFRKANVEDTAIRLSGNIELRQVDIAFKTPGRLVELAVEEGDSVKQGALIARLDPEILTRSRQREEAAIAAAQSGIAQLHTAIGFQKETMAGETDLRRADLAAAEARLKDLEAGARPQEIEQAEAALAEVRARNLQARRDYERAHKLYQADDISTAQHDQFKTLLDSTTAAAHAAAQRLSLLRAGARPNDLAAARAQVARARAALTLTGAQRLDIQRREQEVTARRAELERARLNVSVLDAQLGDLTIHAPMDGVVLSKPADPGEVLAAGTTVISLGDLDHPWLRGYVSERNLGRIRLGQAVRITTDSHPGKVYEGRLSFISAEAEFTPKQIQTNEERQKLVYRIKVDVRNPGRELKANMPADAEIVLNGAQ